MVRSNISSEADETQLSFSHKLWSCYDCML